MAASLAKQIRSAVDHEGALLNLTAANLYRHAHNTILRSRLILRYHPARP